MFNYFGKSIAVFAIGVTIAAPPEMATANEAVTERLGHVARFLERNRFGPRHPARRIARAAHAGSAAVDRCDRAEFDAAMAELNSVIKQLEDAGRSAVQPADTSSAVQPADTSFSIRNANIFEGSSQTLHNLSRGQDEQLREGRSLAADLRADWREECESSVANHVSLALGAGVEHSQGPQNTESFGFRIGPVELFRALPLGNASTHASVSGQISVPLSEGFKLELGADVANHRSSSSAGLVESGGNDLLLPGASDPGFSLPGVGDATDVTNARIDYEALAARLDAYVGLPSPWASSDRSLSFVPIAGVTTTISRITQNVHGDVPNFGFGPDFGFDYNTNINVFGIGPALGGRVELERFDFNSRYQLYLAGTVAPTFQQVNGQDAFRLGNGVTTFADQTQMLHRNDFVLNYELAAGFNVDIPVDNGGPISNIGIGLESGFRSTDDGYYVMRSGAVGGRAQLARDRVNSWFGKVSLNFKLN